MYITIMRNNMVRLDPKNCKKIVNLKTKELSDFVICNKKLVSNFTDYFEKGGSK